MSKRSKFQVPGARFQVPGSRFVETSTKPVLLESDEQAGFFSESAYVYRLREDFDPLLLFATFNGEVWRSMGKAQKGGLVRGVSDILYLQPRGVHPYFACELKRVDRRGEKEGGVTEAEKSWMGAAHRAGAFVCVAYGADEALDFLRVYMDFPLNLLGKVN